MEAGTQYGPGRVVGTHPFRWAAMLGRELPPWDTGRRHRTSVLFWSVAVALSEALLCLLACFWLREVPFRGALLLVAGSLAIQLVAAVAWLYPKVSFGARRREFQPVKAALGLVGLFLSAVAAFYALAVLFGAPFTERIPETFLFSVHLAALTTLPLASTRDTTPKGLQSIFLLGLADSFPLQGNWPSERRTRQLTRASQWAVIGAWAGAVFLPLDWDRPWQEWPAPCVVGATLGHLAGLLVPLRPPGSLSYIP